MRASARGRRRLPASPGAARRSRSTRFRSEHVQVLFCADPGYFQHLSVAAISLVENSTAPCVTIHVLALSRSPEAEQRLHETLKGHPKVALKFHAVDPAAVDGFFVDGHVTRETYLRILAPTLIPAEHHRVLYFDSDLVVLGDVMELWTADLGDKIIGAAPNYPMLPEHRVPSPLRRFGIDEEHAYVNAGVLVIDLEAWRSNDITGRLLQCAREWGPALRWHDQDAINITLHDQIRVIDYRWNFQAIMFRLGPRAFPVDFAATKEARRRPAIVHFTGPDKPWLLFSALPRRSAYFRYQAKTSWRNTVPNLDRKWRRAAYSMDKFFARNGVDYFGAYFKCKSILRHVGSIFHNRTSLPR